MEPNTHAAQPFLSELAAASAEVVFPCAICGHHGRGAAFPHHLTHGLQVWLCLTHGANEFLQRRNGHEFVERLATVWGACGSLTRRKVAALRAHIERIRSANDGRERPGSYSWPVLRNEAEKRFAAGEPPDQVIAELRTRHSADTAIAPSIRTMRRWFSQRRWLALRPRGPAGEPFEPRRDDPKPPPHPLVRLILASMAYPHLPPRPRQQH
jgi:hypothetical protein